MLGSRLEIGWLVSQPSLRVSISAMYRVYNNLILDYIKNNHIREAINFYIADDSLVIYKSVIVGFVGKDIKALQ
jgi:hypothetical protein